MSGWKRFRSWLLVAVFVGGQMLALAHGAQHTDADEPVHACLLCLAGHDLGSAAPTTAVSLTYLPNFAVAPVAVARHSRTADDFRQCLARAPPLS